MRNCRECGFPKKFARFFDWRSDGTIISTDHTKISSQITFLEDGELEEVFGTLSDKIGVSVDRFLIQAQKGIGKAVFENIPLRHIRHIPNKRFFRPQFVASLAVRMVASDFAGLGDGRVSVLKYRAGELLVLRFRNPCLVPLLVGSSASIYESVEEMPAAEYEYGMEGGDLIIRLSHGEQKPDTEDRLFLEEVVPGKGPLTYDRCPSCGVPMEASSTFEWIIDEGIIRNRITGNREVIVSVQSVNAILRELESELGEEVVKIIYDAQRERSLSRLGVSGPAEPETFIERYLEQMALRGLGYPRKYEMEGAEVRVEISNAYNQVLFAARLAACLEMAFGGESGIEWSARGRDRGAYTICCR